MLWYTYKIIDSVDFCALKSYKLLDQANIHVRPSKKSEINAYTLSYRECWNRTKQMEETNTNVS